MLQVIAITAAGIIVGLTLQGKHKILKKIDTLMVYAIWLLLFLLGVSIGRNGLIIQNIGNLGMQALLITLGAMIGSIVLAAVVYFILFKK